MRYPVVPCSLCDEEVLEGSEYSVTTFWALALNMRGAILCERCKDRLETVAAGVEPVTQARIRSLTIDAVRDEVAKIREEAKA